MKERKRASIEQADVRVLGGTGYCIPSDREWEHACLAGTKGKYCFGDDDLQLEEYAWFVENSERKPHPVGELKSNRFGLFDVHGNISEWIEETSADTIKKFPTRMTRGSGWGSSAAKCEVITRYTNMVTFRSFQVGLRLVRVLGDGRDPTLYEVRSAEVRALLAKMEAQASAKASPPLKEPTKKDPTAAEVQAASAKLQTEWAAKRKLPVEKENAIGMPMRLIPPGELVKYSYYIAKYELTQAEWEKVMGYNPATSTRLPNCPVENINWYDCVEFCNKMSERDGLPAAYELKVKQRRGASIEDAEVKILGGFGFRISSELEWEHACRAGWKGKYCFGNTEAELAEYAWYEKNSGSKTHPVGELKPNGFGLYDIHGNVREWMEEILYRGGSWANPAYTCELGFRHRIGPVPRNLNIGLRLVRVLPNEAN